MPVLEGVTPPGMEDVVQRLKKQPGVENPWAIAWSMFHKQGGKAAALSDKELAECVAQFARDRQAGTLLAVYEQAASGQGAAQAQILTRGLFRQG